MSLWNKETLEKEGISLAEKAGEAVLTKLAVSSVATPTKTQGLVALVVQAVTDHVLVSGTAPDMTLLKTSIGQLIEGTVGVLQATGKISASQAAKVDQVAQVVAAAPIPANGIVGIPSIKLPVSIG